MSITTGPNLGLMVNGNQGEGHYSQFMQFLRGLDSLVQCKGISATIVAQPVSPSDGDTYLLPTSSTGAAWAGNDGKIARYSSVAAAWEFYTPKNGWEFYAQDTGLYWFYASSAWSTNLPLGGTLTNTANLGAIAGYGLNWQPTITSASGTVGGGIFGPTFNASSPTGSQYGLRMTAQWTSTTPGALTCFGGSFLARAASGATGTYPEMEAGEFTLQNQSTATITNGYTIILRSPTNTGGGAITNAYGIFVSSITVGSTLNIALRLGSGLTTLADTTDTTAANTGSFQTAGGVYIGKTAWIAGVLSVQGGLQLKRTTVSNANSTGAATDVLVVQIGTMSAARTHTLPAANAFKAGQICWFVDESGSVTGTNTWTIQRAGSDTVEGGTSLVINAAYGHFGLMSDGSSKWTRHSG